MPNSTLFSSPFVSLASLVTLLLLDSRHLRRLRFAEVVQGMVTVGLPWPVLFAAGTIFASWRVRR